MKHNLIIVAVAVASVIGCTKTNDAVPEKEIINPNVPQPESIKFQATIDGPYVAAKVAVPTDSYYTVWEEGDEILIFEGTKKATYKAVVGNDIWSTLEHSSGDVIADESVEHTAYYPASFYTDGLPAVIPFEKACADTLVELPMVAIAEGGSKTLDFKYMCGIAKFSYTNSSDTPIDMKSIYLSAKNPLSGKGTITIAAVPTFVLEGNAGVTIDFGKEGKTLNPGEPLDIYVPLPGAVYKKVTATINEKNGEHIQINYSGKASVSRAGITNLDLNFTPGPDDPIDGTDLSANGTANCYIADDGASYKFPAVKGNSPATDIIPNIASVDLLWETFNDAEAPDLEDFITYLDYTRGWVVFDIASGCYGNAAIAAKDADGNILWSWHIWIPSTSIGSETESGIELMDRHLGAPDKASSTATSNTVRHLYSSLLYQWGRKDPFPGSVVSSSSGERVLMHASAYFTSNTTIPSEAGPVSMETAIQNPTKFYTTTSGDWCSDGTDGRWSATKTIYDPCPAGYRVPDKELWEKLSGQAWTNSSGLFTNGTAYWTNVYYIKTDTGGKGSGNTAIYWSVDPQTIGKSYYNSPVKSKFNFSVTTPTAYPLATGAVVRCQAM